MAIIMDKQIIIFIEYENQSKLTTSLKYISNCNQVKN